jgi:hypothetical protein
MDYQILVSEPAPDRDPRGRCTVAWVVHTSMSNATRERAQKEANRIARAKGRPVLLVEVSWQKLYDDVVDLGLEWE